MIGKLVRILAFAFGLTASSGLMAQAAPDATTANWVIDGCRNYLTESDAGMFTQGVCAGRVNGLVWALDAVDFCTPSEANNKQIVRVVVRYIEQRPQRMHENFLSLTVEALKEAWPCRR